VEVVASLPQGRTAAAQCDLFTHKSVPVIFEPPCKSNELWLNSNGTGPSCFQAQNWYFENTFIPILANNKFDALFHVFIYLISLHVSSITMLLIRISNCINTSSGMNSLCK